MDIEFCKPYVCLCSMPSQWYRLYHSSFDVMGPSLLFNHLEMSIVACIAITSMPLS